MLMTCPMAPEGLEPRQGTHLTVQQVGTTATGKWHKAHGMHRQQW